MFLFISQTFTLVICIPWSSLLMSHKDVYSESTGPDSADFYRLRRQNQKVPLEKSRKWYQRATPEPCAESQFETTRESRKETIQLLMCRQKFLQSHATKTNSHLGNFLNTSPHYTPMFLSTLTWLNFLIIIILCVYTVCVYLWPWHNMCMAVGTLEFHISLSVFPWVQELSLGHQTGAVSTFSCWAIL